MNARTIIRLVSLLFALSLGGVANAQSADRAFFSPWEGTPVTPVYQVKALPTAPQNPNEIFILTVPLTWSQRAAAAWRGEFEKARTGKAAISTTFREMFKVYDSAADQARGFNGKRKDTTVRVLEPAVAHSAGAGVSR